MAADVPSNFSKKGGGGGVLGVVQGGFRKKQQLELEHVEELVLHLAWMQNYLIWDFVVSEVATITVVALNKHN